MGRLQHRTAPSCTYFVTTKTWQNHAVFQLAENAEILVQCLEHYRVKGAYLLHEFVLMPNHLQLLLTPSNETSLEKAIQLIKGGSSHEMHKRRGNKIEVWQSGFHESTIRDAQDYNARRLYIHMNPVEANLVERPSQWLYGTASGRITIDVAPSHLSSGAEAPHLENVVMSELKLRPPKVLG